MSITELAKLRRVTSETLRHYDRIGLIKPDYVDPETKYRYYSIRQYEKLGTIMELRTLGMSLEDIKQYFNDRNLKKSMRLLLEHHEMLKQEIERKIMIERVLSRKIDFIQQLSALPITNTVFRKTFPKRHMITFAEPSGGPRQRAFAITKLEAYLNEVAPILASDRVGVYTDESLLEKTEGTIPGCSMLLVDIDTIRSEYLKEISEGDYLYMYYHGGLEEYHPSFELIKDYMREHGLRVNGPILQIYKVDVTLTDSPKEKIMEIQIPIIQN